MKKILLFTVISIFVWSSCSRGDEPTTNQKEKKIQQINRNNELYAKIYYSGDVVKGIDYFYKGNLFRRYKMYYKNGLMEKMEFYNSDNTLDSYNKYYFEGHLVVKGEFFRKNKSGEIVLANIREYINRTGKINNLIGMKDYDVNGKLKGTYKIEYTDDLGSSISTYYNALGEKLRTETWVKDNKKAYDKYFDAFPYQHEHNNISISYKNLDNPRNDRGYTSVFTYDEYGYPLTSVRKNNEGGVDKFEYIWD